jgi:hypothetical protein
MSASTPVDKRAILARRDVRYLSSKLEEGHPLSVTGQHLVHA